MFEPPLSGRKVHAPPWGSHRWPLPHLSLVHPQSGLYDKEQLSPGSVAGLKGWPIDQDTGLRTPRGQNSQASRDSVGRTGQCLLAAVSS